MSTPDLQNLVKALEVETGMSVPMPPDQLAFALGVDVLEVMGASGAVKLYPDRGAVLRVCPTDKKMPTLIARGCATYILKSNGLTALVDFSVGDLAAALCCGADGDLLPFFVEPAAVAGAAAP